MTPQEVIDHIKKHYMDDDVVCLVLWTKEDVMSRAYTLVADGTLKRMPTDEEAYTVLEGMEARHDAEYGLSWWDIDTELTNMI